MERLTWSSLPAESSNKHFPETQTELKKIKLCLI